MAAPIGDVFVTDSIEQRAEGWARLHVVSLALPLADSIREKQQWDLRVNGSGSRVRCDRDELDESPWSTSSQ